MLTDDYGIPCRETRVLPLGGGANIICSRQGYEREMAYRRARILAGTPFELPGWDQLEVYQKAA